MRSSKLLRIGALAIIIIAVCAGSYLHILDSYELETLDFRFQHRHAIPTTDKVAIIEIGEDTIEQLGRWPFDRDHHAALVKALSDAGARAVIFDILFSEPQAHDKEMASEMEAAGNAYLPFVFQLKPEEKGRVVHAEGYIAKPLDELAVRAKGTGHISIIPDIDGKFRRVPLLVEYAGVPYPYISFLAACDDLGIPRTDIRITPGRYIEAGSHTRIPLDERSNMIINFSGKWGDSYAHYSYVDILQSYFAAAAGQAPILDLGVFKDKVCVVGLTAAGTVDLHPNPFETLYPGMGIHAEVFNSVINRRFVRRLASEWNLLILALLVSVTSFMTLKMRPVRTFGFVFAILAAFTLTAIALFDLFGLWIDLFYPVLVSSLVCLLLIFYKYVKEWRHRIVLENELEIARKIQESFLPKNVPEREGVDIAVAMFTARKVGGDLYAFVESDADNLGVMIGDVSGKGVPASLFMAMVTGAFKFFATLGSTPSKALHDLNEKLVRDLSSNLFVTMFYLVLDMKERSFAYANGGHLPLIYLTEGKPIQFLDVDEGTPLGLMDGPYSERKMRFKEGDIFVLYTDGITEAMNARSEMYGSQRLSAVIEAHRDVSAKALLDAIERDVRKFEPRAHQHDDMTMMVIEIK
ncbi:MAG: CHASE2 domain-containing protein [Candidatus Omnitrophica bacterium]|nr:CHASE2 domain-containing protein [Candidatus Omnitrophota bacterium]